MIKMGKMMMMIKMMIQFLNQPQENLIWISSPPSTPQPKTNPQHKKDAVL